MKEITSRLLNFSKEAVDLKQSLSMALVFIDAALQMEFYNISAVSTVLTSIGKVRKNFVIFLYSIYLNLAT